MEKDLIRKYFLEANPREDRRDCPDEATLKAIAENHLALDDPARLHLASCSPCFAEFRAFKMETEDRQRRRRSIVNLAAIAACLLLAFVLWRATPLFEHRRQVAQQSSAPHAVEEAEASREIDLSRYATPRSVGSGAVQLEAVSLPAAIVHLNIILPRLSPAGHYKVALAADQAGDATVASGEGDATGSDPSTKLSVTLDLRKAARGSYVLSTERGQDAGAYYYPVKVE
jgi:hypothetical protein